MSDALLWTTVIGGALASCRFVLTIDNSFLSQLRDLSIYTGKTTAVVFAAALLAFARKQYVRTTISFLIIVALVSVVCAIPDAYKDIQRMRAVATLPVPISSYAVAWGEQMLRHESFVVSAAVCGLVNCLVLRVRGFKLFRPSLAGVTVAAETMSPPATA